MGKPDPTLEAVLRTLEPLDDAAFATLASVGLLRRARKDLASLTPQVSERDDGVRVDLGAQQVTLDGRGPRTRAARVARRPLANTCSRRVCT